MSFSENTEKLVNVLIDEEYKNACSKYGFEYHSLHEAYAVLLEEVEELESSYNEIKKYVEILWDNIKGNSTYYYNEECIEKILEEAICAISEAAQVGAVLQKIKNTLKVEE